MATGRVKTLKRVGMSERERERKCSLIPDRRNQTIIQGGALYQRIDKEGGLKKRNGVRIYAEIVVVAAGDEKTVMVAGVEDIAIIIIPPPVISLVAADLKLQL